MEKVFNIFSSRDPLGGWATLGQSHGRKDPPDRAGENEHGTPLTLGLAGEARGLFFTSIQDSESRSGRLAERPLGMVFRLEMSGSIFSCFRVPPEALEEPG